MRFLAHEGDGNAPGAPHAEIEGEAASTDTTTLMISDGRPDSSRMAIGLPLHRHAEDARQHLRHGVVHRQAAEHERVARIATDRFDARLEPLIGRKIPADLELADVLLEKAE